MSDAEVIVLIPTRSRPEAFKRAYDSVIETSDADVLAFVDSDQMDLYMGLRDLPRLRLHFGKRHGPVHAINTLCHMARTDWQPSYPNAHIWTYMTDDSIVGPKGWDKWLNETISNFHNEIGIVSGAHNQGEWLNFASMSSNMVNAMGWFAMPNVQAFVWDTALELIGEATRIVWATPEQLHFDHACTASSDPTGSIPMDSWNFVHWCISERRRIISSVRAAM